VGSEIVKRLVVRHAPNVRRGSSFVKPLKRPINRFGWQGTGIPGKAINRSWGILDPLARHLETLAIKWALLLPVISHSFEQILIGGACRNLIHALEPIERHSGFWT
jgi:hypothetical protein